MPKLYDCITLFNELDLLEIRLTELAALVDRFVIVEATRTHKGDPKPLHFLADQERFRQWDDKIIYIAVGDMPEGEGLAAIRRREMYQRNAIVRGLKDAAPDDLCLISDCDEIPRRELLPQGIPDGVIATYMQRLYYYNLNTYAPARPWPGTRACRVADARALSPHIIRNGMGQPDAHYPQYVAMPDGGWHYSYFGGVDKIREKQTQFLHQELVTEENTSTAAIAARVAAGVDIWGREHEQSFVIGAADNLPYAILADPMKWAHLFHPEWRPDFHEDWYNGDQALYVGFLASQSPEGAIVEIGCWEGKSTVALAQMVAPRVVHCVDHWQGNGDEAEGHPATLAAQERDVLGAFVGNMDQLTAGNWQHYVQDWRAWVETWRAPIAFLHLDAAHDRDSVRDCLNAVKPFLVPGAILCGDDFYHEGVRAGVRDALGDDIRCENKRLWEHRWRG